MKDHTPARHETADAGRRLTPLAAIDTREAARRSGWIIDTSTGQRRATSFNSAV